MADKAKLIEEVTKLNLMTPQQKEIVERDAENLRLALTGRPMAYIGGDAGASGYVPGEGLLADKNPLPGFSGVNIPEPELLRDGLRRDEETLRMGTPPEYSGYTKDQLAQIWNEDCEKYPEGLLSYDQLNQDTWQHVRMYMEHQEANAARAKRMFNINQILNPGDERFHFDMFRPATPARINYKLFRTNYSDIRWSHQEERRLRRQELDDDTFQQFIKMRLVTTSDKLIMRKLDMDQAMYDACMDRLTEEISALGSVEDLTEEETDTTPITDGYDGHMEEYRGFVESYLGAHNYISPREASESWGCSPDEAKDILKTLKDEGFLKGMPGGRYRLMTAEEVGA